MPANECRALVIYQPLWRPQIDLEKGEVCNWDAVQFLLCAQLIYADDLATSQGDEDDDDDDELPELVPLDWNLTDYIAPRRSELPKTKIRKRASDVLRPWITYDCSCAMLALAGASDGESVERAGLALANNEDYKIGGAEKVRAKLNKISWTPPSAAEAAAAAAATAAAMAAATAANAPATLSEIEWGADTGWGVDTGWDWNWGPGGGSHRLEEGEWGSGTYWGASASASESTGGRRVGSAEAWAAWWGDGAGWPDYPDVESTGVWSTRAGPSGA
ncbi:hypothetical protein B0H11DRAFT_2214105 [Mycena galericulata]|nr:hypothetical protein B0H11DRAFT_2214105 [Mycena galericulata]